jgi:geranylgeranyl pyrophosphate synthase
VFNSWFALTFQAAQLGLEAQSVIALRLMRLAGGGAPSLTEARLMVTDKTAALTEAQLAAAATVLAGNSHKLATKVLQVFKKRVRANKNRPSNQHRLSRKAR